MRKILLILTLLSFFNSYSQYRGTRQYVPLTRTEDYVTNSPGNSHTNSTLIAYYKDSTAMGYAYPAIEFWGFKSTRNDGNPTSIAWFDSNGYLKRSPMPAFITTEVDPQWNAEKINYYDKTTSDARYLQSYTETDPTVPAYAKGLTNFNQIKTSTDALYEPIFSKNTAFNKNFGISSGTVAEGNDTRIVNAVPNTRTVNGHSLSSDVIVTKNDVSLGNVDNTSDLNKPISTATQSALDLKLSIAVATATYQPLLGYVPVPNTRTVNGYSLTSNIVLGKSDIGLGNVDNTSDLNKPISTATQAALNTKLSAEVDGSVTNELQTLSKVGDNLTISSGNTIALNIPTDNSQIGNGAGYVTQSGARSSINLTTTGSGAATYNSATGTINIPTPSIPIADYTNTVAISSAGNAVFYITSDKTSTGTALYSNITFVAPLVNDSTVNYTYGWSYNAGTKALTVNVKATPALNIALLSLTLLGVPANAANGTNVQVLVKGN